MNKELIPQYRLELSSLLRSYVWLALQCDPLDASLMYHPEFGHVLRVVGLFPRGRNQPYERVYIDYSPETKEATLSAFLENENTAFVALKPMKIFENETIIESVGKWIESEYEDTETKRYDIAHQKVLNAIKSATSPEDLDRIELDFLGMYDKIRVCMMLEFRREGLME